MALFAKMHTQQFRDGLTIKGPFVPGESVAQFHQPLMARTAGVDAEVPWERSAVTLHSPALT